MIRGRPPAAALFLLAAAAWMAGARTADSGTTDPLAADPRAADPPRESPEAALARVDRLEETLLALTPRLDQLDTDIMNLALPDTPGLRLFGALVEVADIAAAPALARAPAGAPAGAPDGAPVEAQRWPVEAAARTAPAATIRLWRPFLDTVDHFTGAHFKLVKGRFIDAAETRYLADVRFGGSAWLASGQYAAADALIEIGWSRAAGGPGAPADAPDAAGSEWSIDSWATRSFTILMAATPLFADVLDRALPDAATLARARRSVHEEQVIRLLQNPRAPKPYRYFQFQSLNQHPGLAVVDVDRDGFDDLYVMERAGANLLLRNRGDGTFEEIAARLGLDLDGHTSSALFADFDNDGDLDAFIGRTLERSRYLVNEGGRFVDRGATLLGAPLPYLVSSVSAADYDGDGLLDVYLSTYGIDDDLQAAFLSPAERLEIKRRWGSGGHMFRDRPGPPNVLLRNLGDGRFGPAPNADTLAVWRNTFQSTWSDYDGDGDMDVYLANDFAPNNLMANDGGGRFTDVTEPTGTADIGFGMGAAWGDYDGDGRQDLYVTNMYSTAGRRITAQLGALGEILAPMARGNTLFRNLPDRFVRLSGLEPPALLVERGGWGWGGQFVDVDNDGDLDIHSLSGYYTAPALPGTHPDL